MDLDTLKQWMASAGLDGKEDADGFFLVVRRNLEISVAYLEEADLVGCFAPLLELAGLDDAQRLEALSQSLALNGVGALPPCCALSYDEAADVVYLLWQQSSGQLDPTGFEKAFNDFVTAAERVQEHLRGLLSESDGSADGDGGQDFMMKV